jgi:DNA-binding winged helix-turn-helix (wHTH) protein
MLARYERLEELEEENRQLRERIARLEGRSKLERARQAFGLTKKQAGLLVLLINRGIADHGQCLEAVYDDREQEAMSDGGYFALNSLMRHLRAGLKPHGISIRTLYGHGWDMSQDNRAKVRRLLEMPA